MSKRKLKTILAEANAPVMPKAPTVREMFDKMVVGQRATEQVLSLVATKLESVGIESARLYNRFDTYKSRREEELKQEVDGLHRSIQGLRQICEQLSRNNEFLGGRMRTLEQIAKVPPLEPLGPGAPPRNDFEAPFNPFPHP